MKSIYETSAVESFKDRIDQLEESNGALWGKMSVKQMLKHCVENEKLLLRRRQFKDVFIGKIFGKMALKADVKNDEPFKKNSPTHPDLKIGEVFESFDVLKEEWKTLLEHYPDKIELDYEDFVHPFFRKMNYTQVGIWAFKHTDHHLRQFGK